MAIRGQWECQSEALKARREYHSPSRASGARDTKIIQKSKKAKELASKKLAHTSCANSSDDKSFESKEISIKKAKHLKAAATLEGTDSAKVEEGKGV